MKSMILHHLSSVAKGKPGDATLRKLPSCLITDILLTRIVSRHALRLGKLVAVALPPGPQHKR